jgi:DNA-binding response OmpR family regulator
MHGCVRLEDIAVVIVEDDDDIRFSLAKYLTGRGATVFACSDAREGLEAVRAHRPDIVLSDIGLPNRNGFDLLRDIRSLEEEQGGEVPVIAMTALERNPDVSRTNADAFQALLRKPFRPDQLLAVVVSTLDSNEK